MSQERWDIVLRILEGPLSFQGDIVCRGPVVRMGANPGPGGLRLDGYRGLDNRQAVVTAYDGGTVSIAPVGANQVRVAPHPNQDWNDIQVLRGPVYLDPGGAFHLGSPERGVTITFVEAQRLGVWEQGRILSDASQVDHEPSNVRQLDAHRGRPAWFIPAVLVVGLATAVGVVISLVPSLMHKVAPLGPVAPGESVYKRVDATEPVDPKLLEGLNQPFHDFVMVANAEQADWPELEKDPSTWDMDFLDYVTRSVSLHARAYKFWDRLDAIEDDYAYVVSELREVGLPEVFAAIPYQESQYRSDISSPVCAVGYWQFMPEVAHRGGLAVRNCKMRGSQTLWSPTRVIPVRDVLHRAPYVDSSNPSNVSCKIQRCEVDERRDLPASTRAAIEMLAEAFNDPVLAESGAAVQIAILSHNGGYDNSRFEEHRVNGVNVLPAYQKYLNRTHQERAPDFYGKNITCVGPEFAGIEFTNKRCGGVLANQTQHYAYSIVAQHMLAVCYYAQNYGNREPFDKWKPYLRGDGYCTRLQVPQRDAIEKRGGK